jgi:hypothetical protein
VNRPKFTDEDRLAPRYRLVIDVLVAADVGWRTVEGGPTLVWIAGRVGLTPRGLRRSLARNQVTWLELKADARQWAEERGWLLALPAA